jgi:hypothetical protein
MKQCCAQALARFKKLQPTRGKKSARIDSIICPHCQFDFRQAGSEKAMTIRPKKQRVYKPKRRRDGRKAKSAA